MSSIISTKAGTILPTKVEERREKEGGREGKGGENGGEKRREKKWKRREKKLKRRGKEGKKEGKEVKTEGKGQANPCKCMLDVSVLWDSEAPRGVCTAQITYVRRQQDQALTTSPLILNEVPG